MKYEPLKLEPEILKFWEKEKIYEKARNRNKGKKVFYFLDGPPYTSGKVHLGTAWNKSLKDCILRYKRMSGFDVLDRAGYDMHGLPTENATEKELKVKGKEAIEKFGVGKFTKACKQLSIRNLKIMNDDFKRLGSWMDYENAYRTVDPSYIDGEWWLVKTANEKGRLYEGLRSMPWDWEHQTALAKHELEYKTIKDNSIYVKLKIKGKKDEYFIIWTTTPWTIPFNLGIMVHPDFDYVKCKVDNEYWIVAKALAASLISGVIDKKFKVVEQFKGKELKGKEYLPAFYDELKGHYDKIKKENPNTHTVVLSNEYVDTSSGSGLVHMAPGCGPEDYEVGHRNKIPPWNTVNEDGTYPKEMGKFAGRHAIKDNQSFAEDLKRKGLLIAETKVEHEYPHGQRSKAPVIFKTTKQWFFKVEDFKDKMIKENNKVSWVPKAAYNAFNSWLENLRDNSISKQRYWGTPLPIWRNVDDADDYMVIGSIKELEKLSGQKVDEPHVPWIDKIEIKKNGKTYKRVPDVLDVWVDAGVASWNSLGYPKNKDSLKHFPADFILEGKDQIRGWFNLLLVASMVAMDKASFKAAYMHGFINDAKGRKMSKSVGNYILPEEVIDKYGADTLRYYMIGGTQAGVDINYNFEDMKVKHKNLMILWNLHRFVLDLAKNLGKNPKNIRIRKSDLDLEEKYIISKLNSVIRKVTKTYDEYKLNDVPWLVEELFLELSRSYLQLTRNKINDEKQGAIVLHTSFNVLLEGLRMFTTIAPFVCERIYLNLKGAFKLKEESINLFSWPKHDEKLIDKSLERNFAIMSEIVQAGLAAREKIQLGVRWPLQEILVVTKDDKVANAVNKLENLIKVQLNVKKIKVQASLPGIRQTVKADYAQLGPDFGDLAPKIIAKISMESPETVLGHIEKDGKYKIKVNGKNVNIVKEHLIVNRDIPARYQEIELRNGAVYLDKELDDDLEAEGFSREIMRRVQALRKSAGFEKSDRIALFIKSDEELVSMLSNFEDLIKEKVGAKMLKISELNPSKKHKHNSKEKVKDKEFELFMDKVSS